MVFLKYTVLVTLIFCTVTFAYKPHFKQKARDRVSVIPKKHSLPKTDECGPVLPTLKFDTTDVAIDNFSWSVVLKYQNKKSKEIDFFCGGFLVNARYVLTTAECISHRNFKLIGVRFGEYDLHNEKDCVCLEIQDGICQIEDCADTIKDIRIESVKVHEEQNNHNIALIRLNTSVNYTSFISPICLPPLDGKNIFLDDQIFAIAGWGLNEKGYLSTKKQITQVVPYNKTTCKSQYKMQLSQNSFCGMGVFEEGSCIGDDGGALAVLHFDEENSRLNWFAVGMKLPKYVPRTTCRVPKQNPEEHPCVYLDIAKYSQWIVSNIRDL